MGRSYFKMIIREFKKSFGRFAAIFGIVALGVGFLSGLLITTPDMNNSVDLYYDENNMADIFIKATMGLTADDLEEVSSHKNVKDIMPAYVIDKLMELNGKEQLTAKIYGIPLLDQENETTINKLELLEGRMPENNRECLVERKSQYIQDIKIGSTLKISNENKDYEDIDDLYDIKTYEVVGVVGNSFHFAIEREVSNLGGGSLDTIIYVDKSSYSLEEYTDFYLVLDDAKEMNSFSSEYQVYTEKVRKRLDTFAKERSKIRKESILDKANKELEDGYEEYYDEKDKAERELADALKEINEGKDELAEAKIDINEAKVELKDARNTLEKEKKKAEKEIADGQAELKDAELELIDADKKLKEAKVKLEDGEKEYLDGYNDYHERKKEIEDGERELNRGKNKLKISEVELADGKEKLRDGKKELQDAKVELEKGESKYRDGLSDLRSGRSKFLRSIEPLAREVGYSSSERLMDTSQGQRDLKSYLNNASSQLSAGISEARDGRSQLESAIGELKGTRQELNNNLDQLNLQLNNLEGNLNEINNGISQLQGAIGNIPPEAPEGTLEGLQAELQALESSKVQVEQGLIEIKANNEKLNAGLAEINATLPQLESQLTELQYLIPELEAKQDEIPDFNTLVDAWDEIVKGQRELDKAKMDIDKGYREYEDGLKKLKDSEVEIADAEILINDGKKEISENEKKLEDAKLDLNKGFEELLQAKLDLDEGKKEYQDGLIELADGRKEYEDGIKEIADAKKTLEEETNKALIKISDGEKELQKGVEEYQDGLAELEEAQVDYQEGKDEAYEELDKAYEDLLEAEAEISDLEDPEWYVLDRDSNMSYVSFELNSDKVAAIATVFPIFFYLVAGLVALTTMTRMVEEERSQIGLLKALGYKKSTIIFKYIFYCGLASTLGSIFGQMVGFNLIPRVIWNTYGVMYHLPEFVTEYNEKIALTSSGVAILSTLAATFFAANGALKEKPALLMLPKPPKKGKRILLERITPLWSIMSFNLKSTARNIFRYKKHFYMTVIGVSGCTALLVTGFGIRDSLKDLGELQFDQLFKYQMEIQLEDDYTNDIFEKVSNTDNISDALQVYIDEGYLQYQGEFTDITLVATEDIEKTKDHISFRQRNNNEPIEFTKDRIIITEKIAEQFNISEGDTIIYENSDEVKGEFKVDSITENYISNYIYMDKSNYERVFNERPENNSLYVKTSKLDPKEEDKLIESLYENDDVLNADFVSQSRSMFDNLVGSINYIVIVIIIASGLLAFIVLYNLTNININERRRELATLKVLGFHNSEVAAYIFREITVLALIGTFVGLILGKYLHKFIVLTIEDPNIMFGRDISITSYIISAIITMIFSIIVDLFMIKKLRNIEMVDSMKAND